MQTIIDPNFLAVIQKKEDVKSRSEYLSTLKPDSEILAKWHSTGTKQRVDASLTLGIS